MHNAAFDEDGLAGGQIDILSIDPQGRGAGQPVDRFIPTIVVMGNRHALQRHLKHIEAAACVFLALQKF